MNERIKQLAEQAGSVYQKNLDVYLLRHDELEKFAELIVQECIEQCVHTNHNNQWDKGIAWAVGQIKQHFGVEE